VIGLGFRGTLLASKPRHPLCHNFASVDFKGLRSSWSDRIVIWQEVLQGTPQGAQNEPGVARASFRPSATLRTPQRRDRANFESVPSRGSINRGVASVVSLRSNRWANQSRSCWQRGAVVMIVLSGNGSQSKPMRHERVMQARNLLRSNKGRRACPTTTANRLHWSGRKTR
jgi:hypothetical protein